MRRNSPHRASLSTPLWKRNRSSIKLEHLGKKQEQRRGSEAEERGVFQFKSKMGNASSVPSKVLPLDYFHPQCRLVKEKGSDKRRSGLTDGKIASAVGKDAVLEKLQVR